MTRYKYIESKSILSRLQQPPDPYFGTTYSMNLYRGCQHACIYCDSRSSVYQLGALSDIRIKKNALHLLASELGKKKKKATIGTGSMNDPYMPFEKEIQLTRGAMDCIANYKFPVHIITKSNLVVRDIDIIQRISKVYAATTLTITTPDDELARKIEPSAPLPSARLKAIYELAKNNLYTGVVISPILPFINDKTDQLTELIRKIKDAGGKYVLFFPGVTLRDGSREYFYQQLDEKFPGIKSAYQLEFGHSYECQSNNASKLNQTFFEICSKYNLDTKIKTYESLLPIQGSLF